MNTETQRPPFKVAGAATIKHLNVRKEGPEDDKILAVDIKMEITGVDRRLCAYFDEALEAFLWRGDTDALIVRNMYLDPIKYGNEIEGATVQIDTRTFMGCRVSKFAITPRDGGVINLTMSVAAYPTNSEVAALANLVQDGATVAIEGPPDLFASTPSDAQQSDSRPAQFDGSKDPMVEQAHAVVVANNKASISLVQRHLKIGYNRAATLLEELEKRGVVSPINSSGARKVLKAKEGGAA